MPLVQYKNDESTEINLNKALVENNIYNEIESRQALFEFISLVDKTFIKSTLYVTINNNYLLIYPNNDIEQDWLIRITENDFGNFFIEYKQSNSFHPWKDAVVTGKTNSIEETLDYLVIAMFESDGWYFIKELKKLYNKILKRKTINPEFILWLEFEEYDPPTWDIDNDFCNIHVYLEDGRNYGLNIWTYKFFETTIQEDIKFGKNLNGLYLTPPDLFVKELTRECIQKSIEDLLKVDDLEKVLNPSIIIKYSDNY